MERKTFDELWYATAKKEIDKAVAASMYKVDAEAINLDFEESMYNRYQRERNRYRTIIGIGENGKLDPHKVAALFYVAFADNTKGYPFNVFDSKNKRLHEAEAAITHETAFNIACGILESFITSDPRISDGYKKYVEKHGMIEPELEHGNKISYKEEVLKQLIYAQREGKLSVAQLAIVFFSLESHTSICYKLQAGD